MCDRTAAAKMQNREAYNLRLAAFVKCISYILYKAEQNHQKFPSQRIVTSKLSRMAAVSFLFWQPNRRYLIIAIAATEPRRKTAFGHWRASAVII